MTENPASSVAADTRVRALTWRDPALCAHAITTCMILRPEAEGGRS